MGCGLRRLGFEPMSQLQRAKWPQSQLASRMRGPYVGTLQARSPSRLAASSSHCYSCPCSADPETDSEMFGNLPSVLVSRDWQKPCSPKNTKQRAIKLQRNGNIGRCKNAWSFKKIFTKGILSLRSFSNRNAYKWKSK